MPTPVASYMIRRKELKLLGAAFCMTDDSGEQIGFCNQKAFRLHEDIRLYTDQTKSEEVLSIRARSVIDFGATYDVHDDNGILLGSTRESSWPSDSCWQPSRGARTRADRKVAQIGSDRPRIAPEMLQSGPQKDLGRKPSPDSHIWHNRKKIPKMLARPRSGGIFRVSCLSLPMARLVANAFSRVFFLDLPVPTQSPGTPGGGGFRPPLSVISSAEAR